MGGNFRSRSEEDVRRGHEDVQELGVADIYKERERQENMDPPRAGSVFRATHAHSSRRRAELSVSRPERTMNSGT